MAFENRNLFVNRRNIAQIAFLHPVANLWQKWFQLAPSYFGSGQTLTANGYPGKVLQGSDEFIDIKYLFTFDNEIIPDNSLNRDLTIINVPDLPGWNSQNSSFIENHKIVRFLISTFTEALIRAHHGNRMAQKILDLMGMAKLVTQTQLYFLPNITKQVTLMNILPQYIKPFVKSELPVLLKIWKQSSG